LEELRHMQQQEMHGAPIPADRLGTLQSPTMTNSYGNYDENGVRRPDEVKVDRLIPDEEDIMTD